MCDLYYEIYIKKNDKKGNKNKYIGYINKKVAFLPQNFRLPSYLTEGNFDVKAKNVKDKGNYFIISEIKLPSIFDIIEIPKNAFKNINTRQIRINNINAKIAKNYIEIFCNSNKCIISLFQRSGNYRDVDMTLININNISFNVLNDINVFDKMGNLPIDKFDEVIQIMNNDFDSNTIKYLVSELFWLDYRFYKETYNKALKNNNQKESNQNNNNVNIIHQIQNTCAYGSWNCNINNLNIPLANKEILSILEK